MREFVVLLKYRLKNSAISKKMHAHFFLPGIRFFVLLFVFGIVIFPGAYRTFNELRHFEEYLELPQIGGLSISEAYFSFISLVMLILGFVNFVPYLIYTLSDYEEMSFLLQLPVKRGTIFIYKAFDAFAGTFMSFSIYLPIAFAFGLSRGPVFAITAVLAALIGFCLMLTIALFVSSFFFSSASRTFARRFNGILVLLNAGIFLALFSFFTPNGYFRPDRIATITENVTKKYLPSYWVAKAAVGGGIEWLLLVFFSIWIFRMAYRIADKTVFELKSVDGRRVRSHGEEKISLLKKEFLLLLRGEQSFFFFLYPLLFSLIMVFTTREMYSSTLVMVMISAFYASQMMVLSLSSEFMAWPLPGFLPLKIEHSVLLKGVLIASIYTVLFLVSVIMNVLYLRVSPILLLSFPGGFMTFFISALLGARFYLASGAYRSGVHKRRLGIKSTLILEILTFVTAIGNIIVLMAFLYTRFIPVSNTSLLKALFDGPMAVILGLGIPILVSIIESVYVIRSLRWRLNEINEGK
ncbi:hypothetical protein [Kosmotoga pacifica]|uniref:Uncharacterized protein n=1 Tax=Kosmotoga pacifica TaxID=1330330 RepID=A0A0G2ZDY4_9BACT|nr:hypothetical protein [Kosmotoga pacifica]AKI97013.1 hypothetical protein IX53_03320 [Kosmotoga pacifica]